MRNVVLRSDPSFGTDGPFMKDMIKAKLDAVLESDNKSPQRPEGMTFTVKPQYINLPAYLTASDWDLLKTSANYHAKIRCICCRLKSMGLVSLAEKSVGSAVACILSSLIVVPEPSIIHKLVQDVKLSFMTTPQCHATPLKYINSYPDDPILLGDEFLLKSYKESKPMLHKPEEYQSLLRIVPLRSTSKMQPLMHWKEAQHRLAMLTKVEHVALVMLMACRA